MSKPILIAVHGMGSPTKEGFKKEVTALLDAALKLYPGYEDKKIADFLQIEVIEYNTIFEKWRKKLAEDASTSFDEIKISSSLMGLIKEGLEAQADIAKDDNLYSHWLDVVFYMTLIGEHIRISVAEQFLEIFTNAFAKSNDPKVSILATSLGTAVIHDSLSKLYTGDTTESEYKHEWQKLKIDASDYSLHALFQIANVSPLLQSFANPYTSIVRPGENGCCDFMFSIDHGLDPIPNLLPFDPDNNEGWLTNQEWSRNIFDYEKIHEINKVNVHDFGHYLANPNVHLRIFNTLLPTEFHVTSEDREAVFSEYLDGTLHKNVKALRDAFKSIKITDSKSIKEIIEAFKKAAEIVKTYEELT